MVSTTTAAATTNVLCVLMACCSPTTPFSRTCQRKTRRSHTAGGLILNGSIISYETGLLIYGTGSGPDGDNKCKHGKDNGMFDAKNYLCVGLRLQYDRRLPSLIDVRIEVPVLLRSRSQWLPVN